MCGYWEHFYTYFCWTFFWHKLILILNPFLSYLNILFPCRTCSAGQVFYLMCFFLSNKYMIWQHKLATVWLQRVNILHICKIYTFTTWISCSVICYSFLCPLFELFCMCWMKYSLYFTKSSPSMMVVFQTL